MIPRLVESLVDIGRDIKDMEAKVFGGANVIDVRHVDMMIGRKNILIAKEYGIPIAAQDIGGERGRHIMMRSDTGRVLLKYIKNGEE